MLIEERGGRQQVVAHGRELGLGILLEQACARLGQRAMEDAVVLAKCLRDASSIPDAFVAYERLRRDRVERIVAQGARSSSSKIPGPLGRLARDLMLRLVFRWMALARSTPRRGPAALGASAPWPVGPDQLMPLAEETGTIRMLTRWVLRESSRQVAAWRQQALDLPVALDVSVQDLHDASLPRYAASQQRRYQVAAITCSAIDLAHLSACGW